MSFSFYFLRLLLLLVCVVPAVSCRKLLEVPPPEDPVSTAAVFSDETHALQALTGLYTQIMDNARGLLNGNISVYAGLSSDELDNTFANIYEDPFRTNTLTSSNLMCANLYTMGYNIIHTANVLLAGLDGATGVPAAARAEMSGEAEFVRALVYFYLVNLYGAVPLVTTTDYVTTSLLPRSPVAKIYQQVIADLTDAQQVLPDGYITTSLFPNDRTRPNKAAATALLARVYLYQGLWAQAEAAADAVIGNPIYQLEGDLDSVFLSGSREAIWQLQPVHNNMATAEGSLFIPTGIGTSPAYTLSPEQLVGFEEGDQRRLYWTALADNGKTYPFKYKQGSNDPPNREYNMVLRLAETYLIRAEARLQQGDSPGAAADLDKIRHRAGLAGTMAMDPAGLAAAIRNERQTELFAEWGHRWLDLKRTGQAETVLGAEKPGWAGTDTLYPLPATELKFNPQLVQNPGYQ